MEKRGDPREKTNGEKRRGGVAWRGMRVNGPAPKLQKHTESKLGDGFSVVLLDFW